MKYSHLLERTKQYATDYLNTLSERRVFPEEESLKKLEQLSIALPDSPTDPEKVIEILNTVGSKNTVASNGGRYFGFVFGGSLPASLAANWLATAWDQNGIFKVSSPISAHIEKVAANWLLDIFNLPASSAVGFVTGTTMANFSAVMAARHRIYERQGWDVKRKGVSGAPPITVIVGEEVHASMLRALILAGFGMDNLIKVPTDDQGRIIAEKVPEIHGPTLICVQAGNVNTGAIDPIKEVCLKAEGKNSWVHVDAAFGLWAAATPKKSHLTQGLERADSWAVDLHKWLNVPYDGGLVMCKDPKMLHAAMSVNAAYLPSSVEAEPYFFTPEMSRRARGVDAWAALYSLGREGVIDLIERCCVYAEMFADKLRNAGFQILNDVTLNQVLVSFGDAELTNSIIKKIQDDGTCWCGGTVWKGKTAMRISVSSWATTEKDIEISSSKIIEIAKKEILQYKK